MYNVLIKVSKILKPSKKIILFKDIAHSAIAKVKKYQSKYLCVKNALINCSSPVKIIFLFTTALAAFLKEVATFLNQRNKVNVKDAICLEDIMIWMNREFAISVYSTRAIAAKAHQNYRNQVYRHCQVSFNTKIAHK